MRTYVLDASGLIAVLIKTPGALKVNELLKDALRGHCRILMSSVNYGEVYGKILRDHGQDDARRTISRTSALPIMLHEATTLRCFRAAEIKATYKLYYADAFAAALALEHKATLVTCDSDFRRLGHGFPILWLKS